MKKCIPCLIVCFLLLTRQEGYSQVATGDWQQGTDFKLAVKLTPETQTLDGFETIEYTNHSPDTLHFIWFHLWANAYKNDRTAFSEYRLRERKTDFYFSGKDEKGYINQLDFKVNDIAAGTVPHPDHPDIIKLLLPQVLLPGTRIVITTPFHIQLPYSFSGNGYTKESYQVKQWYPHPAPYDREGWHPTPFITSGKADREAGNYEVAITVPQEYTVSAILSPAADSLVAGNTKTLYYQGNNISGFSWMARKPVVVTTQKRPPLTIHDKPYTAERDKRMIVLETDLPKKLFDTSKEKDLSLLPAIGYNQYDGLMAGVVLHNYLASRSRLRYLAIPLFGTGSHRPTGLARVSYPINPHSPGGQLETALDLASFSTKRGLDSNGNRMTEVFFKIAPSIRYTFKNKQAESSMEKWMEFKSFLIGESSFDTYHLKQSDGLIYTEGLKNKFRYINQLSFSGINNRVLYPFDYQVQLQQAREFYRINLTGHYFFNYAKGGGAGLRLFAAKFGYLNQRMENRFYTSRYQPKLLGTTGEEDYTYSNYFIGRSASVSYSDDAVVKNKGIAAHQIMIRDGGFKLRTDQYSYLEGRSDDWIVALNLNTSLPAKMFPFKLPVKLFLDIGTVAEAWQKDYEAERFLYNAGIQLCLFREILNIYLPLVYSDVYKDYFNSWPKSKRIGQTLSFSIDIQNLRVRKTDPALPF